jgi:hypothetical protein
MSDDKKPNPLEDLKEGFGLIFRAAKTAVENLPTDKVEDVAKEAAKQVSKTFETIGNEMDKVWSKATGFGPPKASPAPPAHAQAHQPEGEKPDEKGEADKPEAKKWDDAYAPQPPKGQGPGGPRIG